MYAPLVVKVVVKIPCVDSALISIIWNHRSSRNRISSTHQSERCRGEQGQPRESLVRTGLFALATEQSQGHRAAPAAASCRNSPGFRKTRAAKLTGPNRSEIE